MHQAIFTMILEENVPQPLIVNLTYSLIALQQLHKKSAQIQSQNTDLVRKNNFMPIQIIPYILIVIQRLQELSFAEIDKFKQFLLIYINQTEFNNEEFWKRMAQLYQAKSQIIQEQEKGKNNIVLQFIKKLILSLSFQIKPERLQKLIPQTLKDIITNRNILIQFKYDNFQELGASDASIILDSIRSKADEQSLLKTIQKGVQSTETLLSQILISVFLKATQKSLEHYRTIYQRYQTILVKQIQGNQKLYSRIVLQMWRNNSWKAIHYISKALDYNLISPSSVIQLMIAELQDKQNFQFTNVWFDLLKTVCDRAIMLARINRKDYEEIQEMRQKNQSDEELKNVQEEEFGQKAEIMMQGYEDDLVKSIQLIQNVRWCVYLSVVQALQKRVQLTGVGNCFQSMAYESLRFNGQKLKNYVKK